MSSLEPTPGDPGTGAVASQRGTGKYYIGNLLCSTL